MEIEIFDYGMNGEGVGRVNGKICLVPFALVGEKVDCHITKDHSNYCEATLDRILTTSPNRITPKCPNYYECGGCSLQHIDYNEQLRLKTDLVKKTIKKIAQVELDVNQTIVSQNIYNYRNKVSFSIQGNQIGYLKAGSNSLVPTCSCCIIDDRMNDIARLFGTYIKENNIESVRNLVIRIIDDQILVGVVSREHIDLSTFYTQLSNIYAQVGVYLIINKRNDSVVLTNNTTHIGGIEYIKVNNSGIIYNIDILGFQQTNLVIQDKIYDLVLSNIDTSEVVVNAFSGQGLLSAILTKKAKHVYGIELNHSSHKQAQELKRTNNIKNLTNIEGDFNKKIKTISAYDTIVLDPSKKGCGKILESINANKIIYISCNPIALSKDLRLLLDRYTIDLVQPFDMFPQTTSVETLVILKRK